MTIEILESSVQGHSLVAGRHFKPGELVMQEPVLFSVATDRLGGVINSRGDAMLSMQQLSSEVFQEAFESARLSQDQLQSYSIIQGSSNLNRFQIASYDMCAEWSQTPEAFGYGEKGVYLNHSCESNLIYYWNPQEKQMQLRALAEISPSDELTVNYLAPEIWMDKAERQGDLKHLLKLDQCECRKCTGGTSDVSDARIRHINEMEQNLATVVRGGHTLEHVSRLTENFVQQCELELGGKATPESTFPVYLDPRLINVYRLASAALDLTGLTQEATTLRRKADYVAEACFGKDNSNILQHEARLMRRLGLTTYAGEGKSHGVAEEGAVRH